MNRGRGERRGTGGSKGREGESVVINMGREGGKTRRYERR